MITIYEGSVKSGGWSNLDPERKKSRVPEQDAALNGIRDR